MSRLPDWKSVTKIEKTMVLGPLMRAGYSATEMADQFRNATRNSIIGEIHRTPELCDIGAWGRVQRTVNSARKHKPNIKAKRDHKASQNGPKSDRPMFRPTPTRHTKVAAFTPLSSHEKKPHSHAVPLMKLEYGMCKWPIGDPKQPDFGHCGADISENHPSYCDFHHRRSVKPLQARAPA